MRDAICCFTLCRLTKVWLGPGQKLRIQPISHTWTVGTQLRDLSVVASQDLHEQDVGIKSRAKTHTQAFWCGMQVYQGTA